MYNLVLAWLFSRLPARPLYSVYLNIEKVLCLGTNDDVRVFVYYVFKIEICKITLSLIIAVVAFITHRIVTADRRVYELFTRRITSCPCH